MALGTELALHTLGKCSTTELQLQLFYLIFAVHVYIPCVKLALVNTLILVPRNMLTLTEQHQ